MIEEEEPYSLELKKPCYGNLCTSNDYCCPGTVCDWDGGTYSGRCVFARGRRLGELCRRDNDCESGLMCALSAGSLASSVCSVPLNAKQYNEECQTSSDCDISRGLCCQLQRRHRQTHRKVSADTAVNKYSWLLCDLDPNPGDCQLFCNNVLVSWFTGVRLLQEPPNLHRKCGCGPGKRRGSLERSRETADRLDYEADIGHASWWHLRVGWCLTWACLWSFDSFSVCWWYIQLYSYSIALFMWSEK